MMKRLYRIIEKGIEGLLALSGTLTTLIILLIVVFLFTEAAGLFSSPTVEQGYGLYLHNNNHVKHLSPGEIKHIFDGEVTDWGEVGGESGVTIVPYRFDEIFSQYTEEEIGDEYQHLGSLLALEIQKQPGIVAFLPDEYAPKESPWVRRLEGTTLGASDVMLGREWLPTATPAPLLGTLPLLLGTLLVSIVAIILALPLGLGCALYLAELASPKVRRVLKPAIELLAGIPSVVYGFFGLVVLAPIVQKELNLPVGETALTGAVLLAIMALPTIITVAEDALRNTPRAMREASLALGATRLETITRVVVPYAASGISAAVVLGIGRAIGETMAVMMVTGNAAVMPSSLLESVRTIPATIAAELGETPVGGTHYRVLFFLGGMLFLITLGISIAAEIISKRKHSNGL